MQRRISRVFLVSLFHSLEKEDVMKIRNTAILLLAITLCIGLGTAAIAAGGGAIITTDPTKHFDPKGKMPSTYTIELQNGARKTLPFEDKRDFEEAKKGFIAAPAYKQIKAEAGHVACRACDHDT